MIQKTSIEYIGNLRATIKTDVIDGQDFDTEVNLNEGNLCWISGQEKVEFLKEINEVISKYRI